MNNGSASKPLLPSGTFNQQRNSMMQPKTIDSNNPIDDSKSRAAVAGGANQESKDLMASVSQKQSLVNRPNRGSHMSGKKHPSNEPSKLEMWSNKSGLEMVHPNNNGFTTVDINNRFKKSDMSFNFKGTADRIESSNPDHQ